MVCLIGGGGHAADIAAVIRTVVRFEHHTEWDGTRPVIIGINDSERRALISRQLGVADLPWTHPDAYLRDVMVGYGTHVNYGVKAVRTRIGKHSTISPGVTICGDVTIGDRVQIGAGATICEKVTIENDVTVAAGAVVTPGRWKHEPGLGTPGVAEPHVLEAGRTYMGVPACSR